MKNKSSASQAKNGDSGTEKTKSLGREFSFGPEEKDFIQWMAKDTAVLDYFAGQTETIPRELWIPLETLRSSKGDDLFAELVYALTHKFFPREDAKALWDRIVQHKKELGAKLTRPVSIKTSAMDYLEQHKEKLKDLQLFPEEDVNRLLLFANEDGLTGLYNHRYFQERLQYEFLRSQRYRHCFSLMLIDVDHFKQYNDTYGHLKGDILLHDIAVFFKTNCREADVVARYGGDEFAFILPETGRTQALRAAQRLFFSFHSRPFGSDLPEVTSPITISLGLGTYPQAGKNAISLFEAVDRALYRAKRSGRNQICQSASRPPSMKKK